MLVDTLRLGQRCFPLSYKLDFTPCRMCFLPCSHERCLSLNCVAEARDPSRCMKKMSVLSRPKERSRLVVSHFVLSVS